MATKQTDVSIIRWNGSQHPTFAVITDQLRKENKRPYEWSNKANYRYAVRSHNYSKTLYVLTGSLEIMFPDTNQLTQLRAGDRIDIPAGIRHGVQVGRGGVHCVEAAVKTQRRVM